MTGDQNGSRFLVSDSSLILRHANRFFAVHLVAEEGRSAWLTQANEQGVRTIGPQDERAQFVTRTAAVEALEELPVGVRGKLRYQIVQC